MPPGMGGMMGGGQMPQMPPGMGGMMGGGQMPPGMPPIPGMHQGMPGQGMPGQPMYGHPGANGGYAGGNMGYVPQHPGQQHPGHQHPGQQYGGYPQQHHAPPPAWNAHQSPHTHMPVPPAPPSLSGLGFFGGVDGEYYPPPPPPPPLPHQSGVQPPHFGQNGQRKKSLCVIVECV